MLLELILDHSVLKAEAEARGYGKPFFTESLYCQVTGYQTIGADAEEIWNVSGFSEFYYCEVVVTVESATLDSHELCLYHDCEDYPDSPIRIPIASIVERDRYPAIQ
jgi:hypothetical protein